jgi:hypothetical protein
MQTDSPFCNNPDCELNVVAGDPNVEGSGNWATLANGLVVGRSLYGLLYLCDWCVRDLFTEQSEQQAMP